MAGEGGFRRFFAPIGLVLLILGIVEAALAFVFVLLAVDGEFADRITRMSALTALPFILGGAVLSWMGK